jgi:ankyrin repeat protein
MVRLRWLAALACGAAAAAHGALYQDIELDNASAVRRAIESGTATVETRVSPGDQGGPEMPMIAIAARAGSVQVVRALIALKADVDAPTPAGETALMLASFAPTDAPAGVPSAGTQLEIVRALVEAGARIENPAGFSPLAYAAYSGRIDILRYLLDRGAAPNGGASGDEHPFPTPLAMAIMNGQRDAARLLLERGASPRVRGPAGLDAAGLAEKYNRRDFAPMLDCAFALAPGQAFAEACKGR